MAANGYRNGTLHRGVVAKPIGNPSSSNFRNSFKSRHSHASGSAVRRSSPASFSAGNDGGFVLASVVFFFPLI